MDEADIRNKIKHALTLGQNTQLAEYVMKNYTWDSYQDNLIKIINHVNKAELI
jgi:hypothetical protein